jgi:prepilin-type processing-associated H-X9-DG protein
LVEARVLVCPRDRRATATNFPGLRNENLSYFVNVDAEPGDTDSMVAGDGNIREIIPTTPAVAARQISWTGDLHRFAGNVLFGDGHVEQLNNARLLATLGARGRSPTILGPVSGGVDFPAPAARLPGSNPSGANPSGSGGEPGILQQLGDLAKRHGGAAMASTPAKVNEELTGLLTTKTNPALKVAAAISNAPLPGPPPAQLDQWLPRRIVIELTRTAPWLLYAVLLLLLAGILACELLRRHRIGARSGAVAVRAGRG